MYIHLAQNSQANLNFTVVARLTGSTLSEKNSLCLCIDLVFLNDLLTKYFYEDGK